MITKQKQKNILLKHYTKLSSLKNTHLDLSPFQTKKSDLDFAEIQEKERKFYKGLVECGLEQFDLVDDLEHLNIFITNTFYYINILIILLILIYFKLKIILYNYLFLLII